MRRAIFNLLTPLICGWARRWWRRPAGWSSRSSASLAARAPSPMTPSSGSPPAGGQFHRDILVCVLAWYLAKSVVKILNLWVLKCLWIKMEFQTAFLILCNTRAKKCSFQLHPCVSDDSKLKGSLRRRSWRAGTFLLFFFFRDMRACGKVSLVGGIHSLSISIMFVPEEIYPKTRYPHSVAL